MPLRVVSLCPSITESVCDLGRGDALVGVTKYCVHPAEQLESVERVGGTKDPDVARIVDLRPDIVLMNEEENRLEDAEKLRAAGLELFTTLPATPADVAEMLRALGRVLDARDRGKAFADQITDACVHVPTGKEVRFAYLVWRKPWMAASGGTYIDALLSLAGGRNVSRGDRPYPQVTPDDLVRALPDVVFLSTEPFPFRRRHVDELAAATGFEPSRFSIVDGELLSWAGSRTLKGIPYAREVIDSVRRRP